MTQLWKSFIGGVETLEVGFIIPGLNAIEGRDFLDAVEDVDGQRERELVDLALDVQHVFEFDSRVAFGVPRWGLTVLGELLDHGCYLLFVVVGDHRHITDGLCGVDLVCNPGLDCPRVDSGFVEDIVEISLEFGVGDPAREACEEEHPAEGA